MKFGLETCAFISDSHDYQQVCSTVMTASEGRFRWAYFRGVAVRNTLMREDVIFRSSSSSSINSSPFSVSLYVVAMSLPQVLHA